MQRVRRLKRSSGSTESRRIYAVTTAQSSSPRSSRSGARETTSGFYIPNPDVLHRTATLNASTEPTEEPSSMPTSSGASEKCVRWQTSGHITTTTKDRMKHLESCPQWNIGNNMRTMIIDVLIGKSSFASEICTAETSALQAALHISPAYALGGLSENNHQLQHATEKLKSLYLYFNPRLS